MPRKQGGAKKKANEEKKKQHKSKMKDRVKVDPTFGLKNKKGKKHRQFVQNAKNNMNATEIQKQTERHQQKELTAKRDAYEKEQMAIFGTVAGSNTLFETKKQKKQNKKTKNKDEEKTDDIEEDEWTGPLDQVLDRMRAKLAGRKDLTKVSEQTYPQWLEEFAREKQAAKEVKTKKKMQKKGKKGLSGRELFMMDQSMFVDDAAAEDEYVFEKIEPTNQSDNNNGTMKSAQNENGNDNNTNADENGNGNDNKANDDDNGTNQNNNNNNTTNEHDIDATLGIEDESLFLDMDLMDDMGIDTLDETDQNADMEIAD